MKSQLYVPRFYRERRTQPGGPHSFRVLHRDTDLWIAADPGLEPLARDTVMSLRSEIEWYIGSHRSFLTSLVPQPEDPGAPPVVREMLAASRPAGVGPMAAVAGAVAQAVGLALLAHTGEVIVENGGDIFISVTGAFLAGVFAGASPFSGKIAYRIDPQGRPAGLCTSSGTVGHSLSFGLADAVTVLADSAAVADAYATAVGNLVRTKDDIGPALEYARSRPAVRGCAIIAGEAIGVTGGIEIVRL